MGRKRVGGFVFIDFKGDHLPLHTHIEQKGREIGRWNIEAQKPMDDFEVTQKLRKALIRLGYLQKGD